MTIQTWGINSSCKIQTIADADEWIEKSECRSQVEKVYLCSFEQLHRWQANSMARSHDDTILVIRTNKTVLPVGIMRVSISYLFVAKLKIEF